jgi:hypothetical protein
MVVAARILWIRQQVEQGSPAYISFGAAAERGRGKCKVIVDHAGAQTSGIVRSLCLDALSALERRIALASTTDRGHRHSNGRSEITFWLCDVNVQPAPNVGAFTGESSSDTTKLEEPGAVGQHAPIADETAEPQVNVAPKALKSCLKPSSKVDGRESNAECEDLAELEDEAEFLYRELMTTEESVKKLSDRYEGMKADPDQTSFTLKTAHEAVVRMNQLAKEQTSEWQTADAEWKAASQRAAGDG